MSSDETNVVEVAVVGAGPSGCAAATWLAKAGHHVLLLDKRDAGRDKVCGEGLMPHGVDELNHLGWGGAVEDAPRFVGVRYRCESLEVAADFPQGAFGRGVHRGKLNACIRSSLGDVNTWNRFSLKTLVRTDEGFCLTATDGRTVFARAVVGADGLHSRVRRLSGLEDVRTVKNPRFGLRGRFAAKRTLDRVNIHLLDDSEVYLTPVFGGINAAVLLDKPTLARWRASGDLQAALRRVLARTDAGDWLDVDQVQTPAAVTGPLCRRVHSRVADGLILVGDAGGFVDAITGEGISMALSSARLGAMALSEGLLRGNTSARRLSAYPIAFDAMYRDAHRLCQLTLAAFGQPLLKRQLIRGFRAKPALLERLLAVNTLQQTLPTAIKGTLWP